MATEPRESRSVPELLADLMRETTELFRTEGRLIRAEMSDKITQVQIGGGSIAAGAMGELIGDAWAALLVGVVIALIGAALLMKGRRDLSPENLTPDRTSRQLRQDGKLVKEQTR